MANNIANVAKLIIEGAGTVESHEEYNILRMSYSYEQTIDSTHQSNSDVRCGIIDIVLESRKEDTLIEWMSDPIMRKKKVSIKFLDQDASNNGAVMKTLELYDALCFSYHETFEYSKPEPMTVHLRVAVGKLTMNGGFPHTQAWFKEPEKTAVTKVDNSQQEPKVVPAKPKMSTAEMKAQLETAGKLGKASEVTSHISTAAQAVKVATSVAGKLGVKSPALDAVDATADGVGGAAGMTSNITGMVADNKVNEVAENLHVDLNPDGSHTVKPTKVDFS